MSEFRKPRPDGIQAMAHGQSEAHETLRQREMMRFGEAPSPRSTSISTQQSLLPEISQQGWFASRTTSKVRGGVEDIC